MKEGSGTLLDNTLAAWATTNGGPNAYDDGQKGVYREKTMPVGNFPPNAWGLHDRHGEIPRSGDRGYNHGSP